MSLFFCSFSCTFSRHGIAQASLALLIWLNENVRISSATLSIFFCIDSFSFSSISFFEGGCGFEVHLLLVSLLNPLFVLLVSTFRYLVSTFGSGVSTLCFLVSTHCPLFSLPNILALTLHQQKKTIISKR